MKHLALIISLALAPRAHAATQDVKDIDDAAVVMGDCAKIADDIAAMKAPAGHAEARKMRASNEQLQKNPARNPLGFIVPADAHLDFIEKIQAKAAKLDECGARYETAMKAASLVEAKYAKLAGADSAEPAFQKYVDAQKALQKAVAGLSADRQVQSYVHKTLREHFLKDHRKGA